MNISEFHRMVSAALAGEQPDGLVLKNLATQAGQLADMVSWAQGVIDRDGRISDAFIQLQARARSRYEAAGDADMAVLHDALGDLISAILRHDEDLAPSSGADDDTVEM